MTVEEALLALVAAVALVLLFLGLADALEGDPRAWLRGRRRRLSRSERPRPGLAPAPRTPLARRASAASPRWRRSRSLQTEGGDGSACRSRRPGPEAARAIVSEEWRARWPR